MEQTEKMARLLKKHSPYKTDYSVSFAQIIFWVSFSLCSGFWIALWIIVH